MQSNIEVNMSIDDGKIEKEDTELQELYANMRDSMIKELIEESTIRLEMFYDVEVPHEKRLPGALSAEAVIRLAIELYYRKLGVLI